MFIKPRIHPAAHYDESYHKGQEIQVSEKIDANCFAHTLEEATPDDLRNEKLMSARDCVCFISEGTDEGVS